MKSTTTIIPMMAKKFMSVSPFFPVIGSSSTFKLILGKMTRIVKIVIANGLPTSERRSDDWIHPFIAVG
jgi:hypothetical protein